VSPCRGSLTQHRLIRMRFVVTGQYVDEFALVGIWTAIAKVYAVQ